MPPQQCGGVFVSAYKTLKSLYELSGRSRPFGALVAAAFGELAMREHIATADRKLRETETL
jgi:hypothetical protein